MIISQLKTNIFQKERILLTIVKCLLIGPIGSVFDAILFEVVMIFCQPGVKDGDLDP